MIPVLISLHIATNWQDAKRSRVECVYFSLKLGVEIELCLKQSLLSSTKRQTCDTRAQMSITNLENFKPNAQFHILVPISLQFPSLHVRVLRNVFHKCLLPLVLVDPFASLTQEFNMQLNQLLRDCKQSERR